MKSFIELLISAFKAVFGGRAGEQRADFAAVTDNATKLTVSWEKLADNMSKRLDNAFATIERLETLVLTVQASEQECKRRVAELEERLALIEQSHRT